MGYKIKFGFFDSWHTLEHLSAEVRACLAEAASERAVIAIDDAYYVNAGANYAYVNLIRRKLNLPSIDEPLHNKGLRFDTAASNLLNEAYVDVKPLDLIPSGCVESDMHSLYYSIDRRVFSSAGMEDESWGSERFASWLCSHARNDSSKWTDC